MKNKRNIKRAILISSILILFSTKAFAFSDIKESDWFYNDVMTLINNKQINGYPDNTFKPKGNVKNGEVLKMVLGVAGMDESNTHIEDNSQLERDPLVDKHWANEWKILAINEEIIEKDFDLEKLTTRIEVAQMLTKVFKLEDKLEGKKYFEDTDDKDSKTLYNLGIIKGSKLENKLYFYPDAPISRAEFSAILVRIDEYLTNPIEWLEKNLEGLKPKITSLHNPTITENSSYSKSATTKDELRKVFLHMVKNDLYELQVSYKSTIDIDRSQLTENIKAANEDLLGDYPEYFSYFTSTSLKINHSKNTITFIKGNKDFTSQEIIDMKKQFESKAKSIVRELCESRSIHGNMSETEKSRVLFKWINDYADYDHGLNTVSSLGYGLLFNKTATCQGYTSSFNYMAKLLGINVRGALGHTDDVYHIWSIANLDGKLTYIDVTHGDNGKGKEHNYGCFDVDQEELIKTHILMDSRYKLDSPWPY